MASAISSCWRQSQRSEPKTSPVRHCEWMATNGGRECTSPMTNATASSRREAWLRKSVSPPNCPWNPKMRNLPHRVGNSAEETCLNEWEVTRDYSRMEGGDAVCSVGRVVSAMFVVSSASLAGRRRILFHTRRRRLALENALEGPGSLRKAPWPHPELG